MKRKIVLIDENLCNGCGLCVPNCAEGAIQIVDGKARLVADNLCDGLGACLGECPEGAITIVEREAEAFDEVVVEKHLKEIGRAPAAAHGGHGRAPEGGGFVCPSSRMTSHDRPAAPAGPAGAIASELTHWPVKLQLVPPTAPFLKGKELVVAADCAPVAFGDFHRQYLAGAAVVIQCPKFGDQGFVHERLAGIMANGGVTGVTIVRMEVPCCGGLSWAVQKAAQACGRKDLRVREVVIGTRGDVVSEQSVPTGIPVQG